MLIEFVWLYSCCCTLEDSRCINILVYHEMESPFLNADIEVEFSTICSVLRGDLFPFGKTCFCSHDTGLSFYLLDVGVHILFVGLLIL